MSDVLSADIVAKHFHSRPKGAHKGLFGHVLLVGGNYGMPGSIVLAAAAALRTGAGSVTIATQKAHAQYALPLLPEAMLCGIDSPKALSGPLQKATVCVLGPGLGEDEWAIGLFHKVLATELPLVIDASALRLLATCFDEKKWGTRANWVLTPHPGEAAALLSCSVAEVQASRHLAAKQLQTRYGGTIVLKGAGTLIVSDAQEAVCPRGNPGMATAGMGDVLSGVIGACIAQGVSPNDAAQLGVWLHATAGDCVASQWGERGMIASDLLPFLHQLSNPKPTKR